MTERVLLPQDFSPVHYDVVLTPNLTTFKFDGELTITVKVTKAAKTVQLHSRELAIHTASFASADGAFTTDAVALNYDLKEQTVEVVFADEVQPCEEGFLKFTFTGEHNNQMAGFYRSSYTDIDGTKKPMVSTQCEAIDARRVLPCWDEPAAKAVFAVTLIVDSHLTALSNMPEKRVESLKGNKKRVEFMDSPKMSSYLLAMVVGELDFVQAKTEHNVLIRCFSTPGVVERATFALECGVKCLDLYDEYFGLPFPLPKMDMVAMPEFAAGAMENWGLVTYREVDLLVDQKTATSAQKQRVCTVVTHELAHQWFGNLVTMAWWDDLWLNEGFACFLQTWSADILFPEWLMWDQFVVNDYAAALRLDSLRSSHPIQVPIKRAEEVEEVFDAISYCKGACVIRMLNAVMGAEAFQTGLQAYFRTHQYGNTETSDLWSAWSKSSGMPINELAASWTEQMGFPLVKVSIDAVKGDTTTLRIEQSWFLADGSEVKPEEQKTWTLPLCIATQSTPEGSGFTLHKEASFTVDVTAKEGEWIKVNYGHMVPMRVLYTDDLLQRLTAAVKDESLSSKDRAGLLLDCQALTSAKLLNPRSVLALLSAYSAEKDSVVWDALHPVLTSFYGAFTGDDARTAAFKAFAAKLVEPIAGEIGWDAKESDAHLTKLLRQTLISLLAKFSSSDDVLAQAKKRYEAVLADPSDTDACPSDYRTSVFSLVLKNGGRKEFDELISLFDTLDNNADKKLVLHAIGFGATEELKKAALDWTTSGAVKLQDFFYPINSVSSSNSLGRSVAWSYYKENVQRYNDLLAKANPSLMAAVIVYSARGNTNEFADEVEAWFKANPVRGCERRVTQIVESVRISAGYREFLFANVDADYITAL